jgi:hypothetical protein
VGRVHERVWEDFLPIKKGMTFEAYYAAMFGYCYSSISRELACCEQVLRGLPRKSKDRLVYDELARNYRPTLEYLRDRIAPDLAGATLQGAAAYLKGFAYGIECQQREDGFKPSTLYRTRSIYKTLVSNWEEIQGLASREATIRELGEYVARHAVMGDGTTLAQRFSNRTFAAEELAKEIAELRARKLAKLGARTGKTASVQCCQGEQGGAWVAYLKQFEKICGSVNMPRRARGAPRRNSYR